MTCKIYTLKFESLFHNSSLSHVYINLTHNTNLTCRCIYLNIITVSTVCFVYLWSLHLNHLLHFLFWDINSQHKREMHFIRRPSYESRQTRPLSTNTSTLSKSTLCSFIVSSLLTFLSFELHSCWNTTYNKWWK